MRINLTTVYVDDQAAALTFYTEVLGFIKRRDIPLGHHSWLTVVAPQSIDGPELLLEPAEHPAVKPYRDALVEDGIPLAQFTVEDVEAEHARLTGHGVVFTNHRRTSGPRSSPSSTTPAATSSSSSPRRRTPTITSDKDPEPAAVHRSPAGGSSSPPTALPLGPFFHGTKADLRVGDLLTAGFRSNYRPELVMNHIYFTALVDGAGLAAELATGEGAPRVYVVEPTGPFEDDPNVTDKKFPGNPTRSYRSAEPLWVVAELADWTRLTPEALQAWRDRLQVILSDVRGVIIN